MGFANLWAAVFALSIPVIILLWLLKRKRLDRVVSSTYLWEQVLKDPRANAPWQRLKRNLLMILQVLAAALLTFALLRPYLTGDLGEKAHIVLVVDVSGSMQARSGTGTRLDEALAGALDLIDGAGRQDRFTIVAAGPSPRMAASGAVDKNEARAALRSLRTTNGTSNLSQALSLAGSLSGGEGFAAVLFTDATAGLPDVDFPLEVVQVGRPLRNLAVERLTVQGALALARVSNHSAAEERFALELYGLEGGGGRGDGLLVDSRAGSIAPGKTVDVIFKNLPDRFTGFRASLGGAADDLAADDVAFAAAERDFQTKVLLVSRGNVFLEKALALREGLAVVKATPAQYGPGDFSLYIFDGWVPDALPADAGVWVLNPPAGSLIAEWMVAGEQTDAVGQLRPGGTPGNLLSHLSLDDVRVGRARMMTPPVWADVAIEAGAVPLLFTGRPANRPVAVLAFDLHDSNLPLRLAFPVLVQNIVNWLSPPQAVGIAARAGDPVPLALDPSATEALVVTPGGQKARVAPPVPAPPWTETDEIGLYRLIQTKAGKDEETLFAVNFPPEESAGEGQALSASQSSGKKGLLRRTNREIWPWFAGLGLAVISLEWWVYTRGR